MDKWLTNLTIDELKAKILPKPHRPLEINGIPVFMNMDDSLLPGEEFKKHPEKPVEASNFGRIRFNGKILLQRPDEKQSAPYGYLWVEIPDVSKYQLVYRLVAETWCERPNSDYNTVHHISNNGTDNRPENLLWVTSEQHAEIHPWLKNRQKNEDPQDNKDYVLEGSTLVTWCNAETADIPAGVTSIGNHAFADCESLAVINIPDSVTSIGEGAFLGCKNLTAINIPAGVTSIGKTAFLGCESLASIILPPGVTSIGFTTFACCKSLASITLPIGVTSIGKVAFGDCKSLMAINIPAGVTTIEFRAFCGCKNLTAVNIPDSVTSIGDDVFLGCENLGSITVEKQNPRFTDVEGVLFDKLENRILCYPAGKKEASYTIPTGIIAIGQLAFADCGSLTAINIPDSVTDIDNLSFYDCENLTAINIPAGVTTIGDNVFFGCKNLNHITVEKQNPRFSDIDGVLFDKIKNRILCYPAGKKETSYTIPAGITSIGHDAFDSCNILKTVYVSRAVSIPKEGSLEYIHLGENQSIKFVYTD